MNRLGWIHTAEHSLGEWDTLAALARDVRASGLDRTLVCGMGGSSLAPQVLAASTARPRAPLHVLDSTDPAAVLAAERAGDPARTLFVIASKSGTTVETLAFYRYFAARARPDQFVAITDPGTPLEALAKAQGFRAVVAHPADVGGRYAALTAVGMLPAALLGLDGRTLLERARALEPAQAKALGARIAQGVSAGRDKLALRPPAAVATVAHWIEQLVAESSGKDGRGVIPVVDDPVGDTRSDTQVVTDISGDPLDLGVEFLRWEYATWEMCEALGVNAFDQPDVDDAKRLAREELERAKGGAQHAEPLPTLTPEELRQRANTGDYLAILAYLPPLPDVTAALQDVRASWGKALDCVTTLGFGPRYLHSTGQLHKGGPNTGLFLVITTDDAKDLPIPEQGLTFGALKRAQARGDIRALLARGRRVAHVHLQDLGDLRKLRV
jgi:transaldolase/glucose-6-phosphate isomerase